MKCDVQECYAICHARVHVVKAFMAKEMRPKIVLIMMSIETKTVVFVCTLATTVTPKVCAMADFVQCLGLPRHDLVFTSADVELFCR